MTLADLIAYYVNLLIVQYHNKPKAMATIQLFAETMLANNIFIDIENAYNLDTAVGVQLDVIGKYVGVTRYYSVLDLENFFSLETYLEPAPSSPPRWGFCDYATFGDFQYNGSLTYGAIIAQNNSLSDTDYRTLLKFKISLNYSNASNFDIDNIVYGTFGDLIRAESTGNMSIVYFIKPPLTELLIAVMFKRLLPHPIGVGALAVNNITGDMFALTDYSGYETPFGYGFSTYSDYDTLPGEILTYDQISGV